MLDVVLILIAVGVLLWAFNTYVTTIDGTVKQIINGVVIVGVIVWLLRLMGLWPNIPFPRVR